MMDPIVYGWIGRGRVAITGAITIDGTYRGLTIDVTSGTFSISFTAAATLGSGYHVAIYNSGSGTVTLNPNGSEPIRFPDGSAVTKTLAQGQGCVLACTGTGWEAIAGAGLNTATTVTGSGTINRLAMFTATGSVIGNSAIENGTITGVMTFSKDGTTARTMTFPDATVGIIGSASALTLRRVPAGTATSGVVADSLIQDAVAAGALSLAKDGTTARTATFPDLASQKVAASAAALTAARLPAGTATSGVIADSGIADGTTAGGVLTLAASASYTLTVPATGTVGLLAVANAWTNANTIAHTAQPLTLTRTDTGATSGNVLGLATTSGGGLQFGVTDLSVANPVWTLNVNASEQLAFTIGGTERIRIDTSGRFLVGASTAVTTFGAGALTPVTQVAGTSAAGSAMSNLRYNAGAGGPQILVAHSRGSAGTPGALVSGDTIGNYGFHGDDGTNLVDAAYVRAMVSGAVSTGIVPTELRFITTSTAGALLEPLRLDNGNGAQIRTSPSSTSPGSGQLMVRALQVDEQTITTTGAIAALASDTGFIRMTGAAPDVQGITAPTLGSRIIRVFFTNASTIRNSSGSASAANQIITGTGADIAAAALSVYVFVYDQTSTKWRIT